MSPTLKKILLLASILILAGALGAGLYILFRQNTGTVRPFPTTPGTSTTSTLPSSQPRTTTPGQQGGTPGTGTLPTANLVPLPNNQTFYRPEPVSKITSDYTLFPSISQNGAVRYHNGLDGKFYRVTSDGSIKALSDDVFYDVQKVTWAKTSDKAVIEYPDTSKILYDFEKRKQITIPKHWEDFSFSADSRQIAAKSLAIAPENRWLVTMNDDGTGTRLIEHLGTNADRVTVDWSPSQQTVALSQTGQPLGGERREILLLGLNQENFKSIVVEGLDFSSQWSTTGKRLLYSVDSARTEFKPELWIVDAYGDSIGNNRQALQINTWADKCTFGDDDTLFCAVPRELPTGAGIVPETAKEATYDVLKIDVRTGMRTTLPLDQEYAINTISYDPMNKKVLFTDYNRTGAFTINL